MSYDIKDYRVELKFERDYEYEEWLKEIERKVIDVFSANEFINKTGYENAEKTKRDVCKPQNLQTSM